MRRLNVTMKAVNDPCKICEGQVPYVYTYFTLTIYPSSL